MFFNRNARRLGDFAAGTLVIRQPKAVRLEAIGQSTPMRAPGMLAAHGGAPAPDVPNLRRLTGDDYQLICTVLDRQLRGRIDPALMQRLAHAIASKLAAPPPGPTARDAQHFLSTVAEAYRQAAK